MLWTRNLQQIRPSKKLTHKLVGPFRIEDEVGAQAYRLTLPSTYRIHNTFHVSLLEPYHHRAVVAEAHEFMQAPELIDDEEMWEVEEIADKTHIRDGIWYLPHPATAIVDLNAAHSRRIPRICKTLRQQCRILLWAQNRSS